MRGASILLLAAAAGAGTFGFSRQASALGPIDLEVGARAGYGSNPFKDAPPINPLGGGIGARAGVSFFNIYAGASFMYYFGGSTNEALTDPGTGTTTSEKVSQSSFLYGLEAGYNFSILFLTIRPQIGVGSYNLHTSVGGDSADKHNVYIEPRATALIGIGLFYFGADVGVLLTPGLTDSKAALLVNGQIGLKF
jgi:hypothetical protein